VPVWQARELLKADLGVYEHKRSGALAVRAEQYSVPEHVSEHLDYIGPLTLFTEPRAHKSDVNSRKLTSAKIDQDGLVSVGGSIPGICNPEAVTSRCLRTFYKTIDYVPRAAKKFFLGVSGFLEQYPSYSDFTEFLVEQRQDAALGKYNFTVQSIAGGQDIQSMPGTEANLDVQTVGGFIYPIPFTFYSTGGSPPYTPDLATVNNTNEPYEAQMNYLLSLPDSQLPKVLSTSYGDDEQSVPKAYAERVCNYIMSLGARGVSTIYSSGDNGVGTNGDCVSNGVNSPNGTATFLPAFPASCPYATTVGATQGFSPETAVNAFASGGGFSNYFARPSYQASAVDSYLKGIGNEYAGLYNTTGRGYPDVAANGQNYVIVISGVDNLVDGTSASAPTFSSVIGLLNDYRISQGKSSLGFLNPLIYSKWLGTAALNDITQGSSAGCNTSGFPATKGWDAVTGAGTPNFIEMKAELP